MLTSCYYNKAEIMVESERIKWSLHIYTPYAHKTVGRAYKRKKWASWGRYTEKKHRESKKADKLNQIDKHSMKALTSRKNIAHNKRTYENVKNKLHNYNLHCHKMTSKVTGLIHWILRVFLVFLGISQLVNLSICNQTLVDSYEFHDLRKAAWCVCN